MGRHILTVDLEDNFTYEELINKEDWRKYESQVVENSLRILFLLKKYNARATFFVVGKVAERHPEIIEYITKDRHEIASHSYWHKPLGQLTPDDVEEDVRMSSEVLSSLSGKPVLGYRAMGFSIPEDEIEFFRILKKYGYIYDSSRRYDRGTTVQTVLKDEVYHIHPATLSLFRRKVVFSGGTYFRVLPLFVINKGFSYYMRRNQPVLIYVHAWEFNRDQPRRKVPFLQRVLQSPITFTTEKKLTYLLQRYSFVSVKEYLGL